MEWSNQAQRKEPPRPPSIQPNLGLPLTHPQHPSSQTALIHSLHVSKQSQYSPIHSTRQLPSYSSPSTNLFIPNSIHSWHSHQTSQKLHLENIHFPSLSTSHAPYAFAPYNVVGAITPSYRHFVFIPNPLLHSTLFITPQALCPSFIVYHIVFSSSICWHFAIPGTWNNPLPLTDRHSVLHTFYIYFHILSTS